MGGEKARGGESERMRRARGERIIGSTHCRGRVRLRLRLSGGPAGS